MPCAVEPPRSSNMERRVNVWRTNVSTVARACAILPLCARSAALGIVCACTNNVCEAVVGGRCNYANAVTTSTSAARAQSSDTLVTTLPHLMVGLVSPCLLRPSCEGVTEVHQCKQLCGGSALHLQGQASVDRWRCVPAHRAAQRARESHMPCPESLRAWQMCQSRESGTRATRSGSCARSSAALGCWRAHAPPARTHTQECAVVMRHGCDACMRLHRPLHCRCGCWRELLVHRGHWNSGVYFPGAASNK
jgi:hypothetical protein